jgi:hypothetical protein
MADIITEAALFKPKPSKSESKADTTTNIARAILDDEATRREVKTAKLRAARLAMEEQQAAEEPVKKPAKAKKAAAAPAKPKKAATKKAS